MDRRSFMTLLGSAAAWSIPARAQNLRLPLVGFLSSLSAGALTGQLVRSAKGCGASDTKKGKT